MFSRFFVCPAFEDDAIAREVSAVDAEHRKNAGADTRRMHQFLKHIAHPEHVTHRFATGP